MTDQTPRTEHCEGCGGSVSSMGGLAVYDCLGIEAQARTEALREAAERVRALPETGGDIADIPSLVRRDAVLAILAGETE